MLYKEIGFRNFINKLYLVKKEDIDLYLLKDYRLIKSATHIVAYSYIEHDDTGICIEIVGTCHYKKDGTVKHAISNKYKMSYELENFEDRNFELIEDEEIIKYYMPRIMENKRFFNVSEDIVLTRKFQFLDNLRHDLNPDAIKIEIFKKDLKTEYLWGLIEGYNEDNTLDIKLLTKPLQKEYKLKRGSKLKLSLDNKKDGFICRLHNLNIGDFDDLLKTYFKEPNDQNLINVITKLSNIVLYVPYLYEFDEEDEEILSKYGIDSDLVIEIIGDKIYKFIKDMDERIICPVVFDNEGHEYIGAYTDEELITNQDIKYYESNIFDLIKLKEKNYQDYTGIVINHNRIPLEVNDILIDIIKKINK